MSREVYFQLVDEATRLPLPRTFVDAVILPGDAKVIRFRGAVFAKVSRALPANVIEANLLVYASKAAYDDENAQSLDEDLTIGALGASKKDALIVELPPQQRSVVAVESTYSRVKSLYSLSSKLSVILPNMNCEDYNDLQEWEKENAILSHFFCELAKKEIKCLVLDEAARDLGLVEFLVKAPGHLAACQIIISGTPPCGNGVDYGGSVAARVASVSLGTLRGYEVRSFLNELLGTPISPRCWLDFWTIFNGEPGIYQQLALTLKLMNSEPSHISEHGMNSEPSHISEHGVSSIFRKCNELIHESKFRFGIADDFLVSIGNQSKRSDVTARKDTRQKIINELLARKILITMPTVTEFKKNYKNRGKHDNQNSWKKQEQRGSILSWKDPFIKRKMRNGDWIDPGSFPKARGFGLEDLAADLFDWHITKGTDLEKELGLSCMGCEILFLDYEGNTDADLLLVQNNGGKEERNHLYVFNIKTNPNLLLNDEGHVSRHKFQQLCQHFDDFDVILVLMVEDFKGVDCNLIYDQWKCIEGCKLHERIYSLSDFVQIGPDIKVQRNGVEIIVDRPLEKERIKSAMESTHLDVAIQGRYRVGKSHLLMEMSKENQGWAYNELQLPP